MREISERYFKMCLNCDSLAEIKIKMPARMGGSSRTRLLWSDYLLYMVNDDVVSVHMAWRTRYHRIEFYEMMNLNNVVSAEVFFAGNFCFLGRARN
jgi:hypothetical protein